MPLPKGNSDAQACVGRFDRGSPLTSVCAHECAWRGWGCLVLSQQPAHLHIRPGPESLAESLQAQPGPLETGYVLHKHLQLGLAVRPCGPGLPAAPLQGQRALDHPGILFKCPSRFLRSRVRLKSCVSNEVWMVPVVLAPGATV